MNAKAEDYFRALKLTWTSQVFVDLTQESEHSDVICLKLSYVLFKERDGEAWQTLALSYTDCQTCYTGAHQITHLKLYSNAHGFQDHSEIRPEHSETCQVKHAF